MLSERIDTAPIAFARVAGALYLVIFLVAPFAEFVVRQGMIVADDPTVTAANIRAGEFLFRAATVSDLTVFTVEVAQAGILFLLLAPVSRTLALIMSFGRLAQATILGLNLLNQVVALNLITGSAYLDAFGAAQRETLALVFLNAQGFGYEIGLVFFGLHLGVLGYLVARAGYVPRWIGLLLVVSALGYFANSFTQLLFPEYEAILAQIVVVTAVIGELPLTLWLLIKGVDAERWNERARGHLGASNSTGLLPE